MALNEDCYRKSKGLKLFYARFFIADYLFINIDMAICLQARQLVKNFALSHAMEMVDVLITATALLQDELLCTNNAKHFLSADGLKLEIYSPSQTRT